MFWLMQFHFEKEPKIIADQFDSRGLSLEFYQYFLIFMKELDRVKTVFISIVSLI